jgi:hypothetical protein
MRASLSRPQEAGKMFQPSPLPGLYLIRSQLACHFATRAITSEVSLASVFSFLLRSFHFLKPRLKMFQPELTASVANFNAAGCKNTGISLSLEGRGPG